MQLYKVRCLVETISLAREEFHSLIVDLSKVYEQHFPDSKPTHPTELQPPSSSVLTAVSGDSADLPVEVPSTKSGSKSPTFKMTLLKDYGVWLRYPSKLETSVTLSLEKTSLEPISNRLLLEQTEDTHHLLPIVNVVGIKPMSSTTTSVESGSKKTPEAVEKVKVT
uniref:Mediator of RNA polymerase II transcription subunit 1 n=1 Tax=Panagrellus redivivus TaxID=6233 RepID=A0A7E4VGG7_PANRE